MSLFDSIIKDLRLIRLRYVFKGNTIYSPYVHPRAKLSHDNRIDYDTVITENVSMGVYSFVRGVC